MQTEKLQDIQILACRLEVLREHSYAFHSLILRDGLPVIDVTDFSQPKWLWDIYHLSFEVWCVSPPVYMLPSTCVSWSSSPHPLLSRHRSFQQAIGLLLLKSQQVSNIQIGLFLDYCLTSPNITSPHSLWPDFCLQLKTSPWVYQHSWLPKSCHAGKT